jgi:hypothetical protein
MTDESKLALCIVLVVVAIILVARFPGVLVAFLGKATARCRDGSFSYSAHRCGTCSHRGGVSQWFATVPV